jgi:hypothetical protein
LICSDIDEYMIESEIVEGIWLLPWY